MRLVTALERQLRILRDSTWATGSRPRGVAVEDAPPPAPTSPMHGRAALLGVRSRRMRLVTALERQLRILRGGRCARTSSGFYRNGAHQKINMLIFNPTVSEW